MFNNYTHNVIKGVKKKKYVNISLSSDIINKIHAIQVQSILLNIVLSTRLQRWQIGRLESKDECIIQDKGNHFTKINLKTFLRCVGFRRDLRVMKARS